MRRKISLGVGVAALAATIALSALWSHTPDYRVLFANLNDRDGGSVIASLTQMNVPYRYAEGGGAILVPAEKLHDVRLRLASQGLPKGGTVGFELLESQKFGVTQFQERLNFQRGLEGELARTIQSLAAVQSARVHLALPAQTGFLRDQQKPSASVLLTLHPARSLDRAQVDGIIHLVASSVPEMSPKQVSIVDQNGNLLSNADGPAHGLDPAQFNYVRQMETNYVRRIVDIVEPILGAGNVHAQVNADIDFTQSEATAEEYRPNQGKDVPNAIRSQQVSESASGDANAGQPPQGIAGALSNQPAAQSTAPINGAAQALQAAGPAGAQNSGSASGGSSRRDATTNYEVDKTVRVTRSASGQVRRLTAAVVLNNRSSLDKDGKTVSTPLTEAEMENITALIREAIGISKDRGDSVNVVNAAFQQPDVVKEPELPLWKQPENIAMAKEGGKHVALILLGLITIFGFIRPALRAMSKPPALSVNETVQNDVQLPAPPAPPPGPTVDVLKIAREDPVAVANVVRSWVTKNG